MKNLGINLTMVLLFLIAGWTTSQAQEQINVPGDNFSLEGALELFKKSASPEEFEKMLNDPDSKVNNLDLNGDGYIDYIRVIDKNKKNVHAFIMQAIISDSQAQDVAVITLEKLSNGKAVLQITGDEDVYGVETIIEPTTEVRTYGGTQTSRTVVNVWAWPSVQYIYSPYYSGWVSPWGWGYRPVWWSPWRPIPYYSYYPYWRPYRPYYSPSYVHRIVYAEQLYRPHRTTSVIVINRTKEQIQRYRTSYVSNSRNVENIRSSSTAQPRSSSVKYDDNGRISTSNKARVGTRSSSNIRVVENSSSSNSVLRSSRESSVGGTNSNARKSSTTTNRYNTSENRSRSVENPSSKSYDSRSSEVLSSARSSSVSSGSSIQRNSGSSNSNARQSSSSYSNQRSSSGSSVLQRSSGSSDSQRSSGYSSPSRSKTSSATRSSTSKRSSGESNLRSSNSESKSGRSR